MEEPLRNLGLNVAHDEEVERKRDADDSVTAVEYGLPGAGSLIGGSIHLECFVLQT
jgi:hypothetical protein